MYYDALQVLLVFWWVQQDYLYVWPVHQNWFCILHLSARVTSDQFLASGTVAARPPRNKPAKVRIHVLTDIFTEKYIVLQCCISLFLKFDIEEARTKIPKEVFLHLVLLGMTDLDLRELLKCNGHRQLFPSIVTLQIYTHNKWNVICFPGKTPEEVVKRYLQKVRNSPEEVRHPYYFISLISTWSKPLLLTQTLEISELLAKGAYRANSAVYVWFYRSSGKHKETGKVSFSKPNQFISELILP